MFCLESDLVCWYRWFRKTYLDGKIRLNMVREMSEAERKWIRRAEDIDRLLLGVLLFS